jgi:hypothetical protein
MCDKSYSAEDHCWCPPLGHIDSLSHDDKLKRRIVTMTRQINERIIGRLTFWGCFKKKWNYSWESHFFCAHVAAKLTQLEVYCYPLT